MGNMPSTMTAECKTQCEEVKKPSDIAAGVGWAFSCICSCCCCLLLLALFFLLMTMQS
jgi:Na+(H+)/acetate symporter ActP